MARGDFPFNRLELNLQPIVARPRVRAEVGVQSNDRRPGGPTRLDVYSPPQVLQINGRIYQLVLAFLMVGDVANSRAPLLHGRYSMQIRETIDNPSNIGGLFAAAQTREQAQFICWNDCDACRHRIRSM